jgi:hypothetical protein
MNITEHVLPLFDAYKNEENIEVEIRLGKHNGSLFDTNVGKEAWTRVLRGLKKYEGWERVEQTRADVYYNDSNNVRITVDEEDTQVMIQKIAVVKRDFTRDPFDVRFSVSREIPTTGEYSMDRKRTKVRHSFVRKNLSIDMTISTGDHVDMDSEEEASYQIELEIIRPKDVDTKDTLFNIIHKIENIVALLATPCS